MPKYFGRSKANEENAYMLHFDLDSAVHHSVRLVEYGGE
jgi:hypothetical protein